MRVNSEITELVLSGSWATTCKCKTWHGSSSQEKVFLTGLPPCQQGSESGQAGDFSKLEQISFPCEDIPRLAESLSLNNRKGKPWFLFVSLGACETEGGTKLGLCLLKVHMCWILLSPLSCLAPCWVSCFTRACSSDFTAPLSTSSLPQLMNNVCLWLTDKTKRFVHVFS